MAEKKTETVTYGFFDDIPFGAQDKQLLVQSCQKSVTPTLIQHKTLNDYSVFEAQGKAQRTVSISGLQHIQVHKDPMEVIRKLEEKAEAGVVGALVFGAEALGFYIIQSLQYTFGRVLGGGAVESVSYSLTFQEARVIETASEKQVDEVIDFEMG